MEVSPAVREAVGWARAKGVRVVISTGRICGEASEFARLLGTDDEMVTSGGAAISWGDFIMRVECGSVQIKSN